MNILAQIIGVIALIATVISFQQTKRKKYLFFQVIASLSYALHYLLLNAISAVVTGLISLVKNIVFYSEDSKKKEEKLSVLIIFSLLIIISSIFTYNKPISLLPIFITLMHTYGSWQKNLKITYVIAIINSILWVIYNYSVGSYILIINSIIELIAGIRGFIKLNGKSKK